MRLYFTSIPALGDPSAEQAINRFLASHRVLAIDRRFVEDGPASIWAICVTYAEQAEAAPAAKPGRIDYRELLPEAEFQQFARLRALRKTTAEREGVPPYAVFTNEQLAAMVQKRARTTTELAQIEGIGKARIDKYGAAFLASLAAMEGLDDAEA